MAQNTDLAPARLEITEASTVENMLSQGTLVADPRRTRALFFNGRFLAALDLNRERDYVLQRQADLARSGGTGVVSGLQVSGVNGTTRVTIRTGFGVTPSGELVTMPRDLTVDLADIPDADRLNAAFGLSQFPSSPMRNRSGLYVLALRPVEFTANPIAAYPTSLSGTRTVHDGDVIEATAITLIPFLDSGQSPNALELRATAAARIFASTGSLNELSASALPVAMVMIDGGFVRWVDPFMVRREVGAEHEDTVGLGLSPRALREAFILQYDQHLSDVVTLTRNVSFAAADYFRLLPPAGRLPAATIDPSNFSQIFFPSQVDVELSVIPDDELPALLEESMLLAPIDLTQPAELASTAVLVLVPKPRTEVRRLEGQLQSLQRRLTVNTPGLLAQRQPIDVLRSLLVPRPIFPVLNPADAINAAWRVELANVPYLYYVRRRHLAFKAAISSIPVAVGRDEVQDQQNLTSWLGGVGSQADFDALKAKATAPATAELTYWLSSPMFDPKLVGGLIPIDQPPQPPLPAAAAAAAAAATTVAATKSAVLSGLTPSTIASPIGTKIPIDPPIIFRPHPSTPFTPLLLHAAIADLKQIPDGTLTRSSVLGVEQTFADPDLGVGITILYNAIAAAGANAAAIETVLAQTHQVPTLDRVARKLSGDDFTAFVQRLITLTTEAAPANAVTDTTNFIITKSQEIQA